MKSDDSPPAPRSSELGPAAPNRVAPIPAASSKSNLNRLHEALLVLVGLFGIGSIIEARSAIFSLLLLVIGLASLSNVEDARKKGYRAFLLLSLSCALAGMARFVWQEALPGIAEARGRDSGKKAVSVLREILFAQDALRRYGWIDPDGDGVGSAGTLAELSGSTPPRGSGPPLPAAPLASRLAPRVATNTGPATEQEGHLFVVCLPNEEGGFSTHPMAPIDEEHAERRWVAYAWPAKEGLGHNAAYFIDEHERILTCENLASPSNGVDGKRRLRLVGPEAAPSCDDALSSNTKSLWQPWQGKQARMGLVGDH